MNLYDDVPRGILANTVKARAQLLLSCYAIAALDKPPESIMKAVYADLKANDDSVRGNRPSKMSISWGECLLMVEATMRRCFDILDGEEVP